MGSKFAGLAVGLIVGVAWLPGADAEPSGELVKQGLAKYRAGDYKAAVDLLRAAYRLEAKPDTLFSLAQAERNAGDCAAAVPHYKQLLAQTAEPNAAKLIQGALDLCPASQAAEPAPGPAPVVAPAPTQPTPAAPASPRVVVREVQHGDLLATTMVAGGVLGLGVATGLLVASGESDNAATQARTLEDYHHDYSRGDTERTLAYVAGGVGVAMLGVAVYRWATARHAAPVDVGVAPTPGGGAIALGVRW